MPTYEYECEKCGNHFEEFQQMVDKPVDTCPDCSGKVRRLIGMGAGVIMKSSGPSSGPPCIKDCEYGASCCGRGEPCGNHASA